jgi:hypothetical protein
MKNGKPGPPSTGALLESDDPPSVSELAEMGKRPNPVVVVEEQEGPSRTVDVNVVVEEEETVLTIVSKPEAVRRPTTLEVVVAAPKTLIEQLADAMNRLDWEGRVETIRKLVALTGLEREFNASIFDEIYRLHAQDKRS